MPTRPLARLSVLALVVALLSVVPGPAASAAPPSFARADDRGPHPVTELVGQFPAPRMRPRQVQLVVSKWGFRFWGAAVGNRLTITEVGEGRLRFADAAARRWVKLPGSCRRTPAARGVAATCTVPPKFRSGRMFLEVFPQLGNDVIDTRALPPRYRSWVLVDAGNDRISTGAGDDFVNGAFGSDAINTGAGDDWVRAGIGTNRVSGGAGDDELAGGDNRDTIRGGPGDDRVSGGPGNDVLWGDEGSDTILGGPGRDTAYRDRTDRVSTCEVVRAG